MAVPTVPNESPSNPAVLAAYRLAADIANSSRSYHVALAEALEFAVGRCSAGARIIDVCRSVDEHILGLCSSLKDASPKGTSALLWKGVAFPTCISTNNLLCHFSPVEGDAEAEIALQPNDLAKMYRIFSIQPSVSWEHRSMDIR
jgi:methionine aminopeptidase